jgi:urea transporter/murein DD-endopeptidase MepM/ murein hydrolase activator NlpD
MADYKNLVHNILKPYSAVLFLNNKYAGLIILITTFINPSVAASGLAAVFFTIIFTKLIEFREDFLTQGFYIYNSLLVGMGIGYLFAPSIVSITLIAVSSAFTFLLSFMLYRLMSVYQIPTLSLPFAIVSMFVSLASIKYSYLFNNLVNLHTIYDIDLPVAISGFLKSLGTLFFLPNNIAGLVFALLILFFSRIMFILAILGFYFGVLFHSYFLGSFEQALSNPYAFNYIIVATALGGVFLIPSMKNIAISIIGVAISVVLVDAINILFNYYGIPVFTLPFNIIVITFIFVLSMTYYQGFNYDIKETPEESLRNYLSNFFRFAVGKIKIALPFSGEWCVYQAFDDEWTHKGEYKYAYDFVKKRDGKTYKNDGLMPSDYYAFGESVLSPVNGYVVDIRDNLPDNPIGEVDRINNWGNYIIIRSDFGFFVEISHLMQYSSMVKIGDYVHINTPVAKCGNSGYSPEPHIHIQVQSIGVINAFTKEFIFNEYYLKDKLLFNSLPPKGEEVGSVIINQNIKSRLSFILDEKYLYDVYENDTKIVTEEFIVSMNAKGEFCFKDKLDNELYFNTTDTMFYFYNYIGKESYLKKLFIAAPRVPFVNKDNITFEDYLPVNLIGSKFKSVMLELASVVNKNFYKKKRSFVYKKDKILSDKSEVELSQNRKGFEFIKYKTITLKRKNYENR